MEILVPNQVIQKKHCKMEKLIKIVLAVLMFGCLLKMPYGYYQLVRFLALIGFGILAYDAHQKGRKTSMLFYGALAILFQPLFKIALGRSLWNIVNVIIGINLLISLFAYKKRE